MKPVILAVLGLSLLSSAIHAQTLSPRDFAYTQAVIPERDAAAYRFSLPLAVYQNTVSENLQDVRVFNGEGVAIPYALSRAAAATIRKTAMSVPMFPLHEGARILIDGVHLTINSAGSAVNLQTQNGTTANAAVRQYLLDARALDATLSVLQLGWADGGARVHGSVKRRGER